MRDIEIKSFEDYTKNFNFYEDTDFFRGHADLDYKLLPIIGRLSFRDKDILEAFEQLSFADFKKKSPIFLPQLPQNDFEWLFLAQHYGLPTRLLDWTYNPLVALFFAIENDKEKDCCVYRSNIYTPRNCIDLINEGKTPTNFTEVVFIAPTFQNIRYQNQNSIFSIHPNPEAENENLIFERYIIRKEYKREIRIKLRKLGINKTMIFPSLDSLTYDLTMSWKNKYNI